jgi:hypothetical protein
VTFKYLTCGHPGCQGHVGKFSSCRDEVIYAATMDSADETFGDTDWHGHYAMVVVGDDPSWTDTPESSEVPLKPEPGVYVVFTAPSGQVGVDFLGNAPGVMATFEARYGLIRDEYYAWSSDGDD